jgi:hypothetical protein
VALRPPAFGCRLPQASGTPNLSLEVTRLRRDDIAVDWATTLVMRQVAEHAPPHASDALLGQRFGEDTTAR